MHFVLQRLCQFKNIFMQAVDFEDTINMTHGLFTAFFILTGQLNTYPENLHCRRAATYILCWYAHVLIIGC